jgi:hypothetical protein
MGFQMLLALLFFSLNAYADSMRFDCALYFPADQQGKERFMKVEFPEAGGASLKISDLTSPYNEIENVQLSRSYYTDQDETAGAVWISPDGKPALDLALAYFGTHWVGHLTFHQPLRTPELEFSFGEEIDFRCRENPY